MILLDGFHNLEEISSYKEVQFGKVWLPAELVRRVHILISRLGTRWLVYVCIYNSKITGLFVFRSKFLGVYRFRSMISTRGHANNAIIYFVIRIQGIVGEDGDVGDVGQTGETVVYHDMDSVAIKVL